MASLINIPVKLFYITQCIPVGKQPFAAPPAAESCRNMDKTMTSTPLKHTPALLLLTMKKVNSIWRQAQIEFHTELPEDVRALIPANASNGVPIPPWSFPSVVTGDGFVNLSMRWPGESRVNLFLVNEYSRNGENAGTIASYSTSILSYNPDEAILGRSLAHEMGHALGLQHEGVSSNLMHVPQIAGWVQEDLTDDQIATARSSALVKKLNVLKATKKP